MAKFDIDFPFDWRSLDFTLLRETLTSTLRTVTPNEDLNPGIFYHRFSYRFGEEAELHLSVIGDSVILGVDDGPMPGSTVPTPISGGADVFVFDVSAGNNVIRDFEIGIDRLELSQSFAADALTFAATAPGGTRVTFDTGLPKKFSITFEGLTVSDVTDLF